MKVPAIEHEGAAIKVLGSLPIPGPQAKPQTVEIHVTPWRRISVRFRPVRGRCCDEAVWYWQPDTMMRLDQ